MLRKNCYTNNGIVKSVLSEESSHSAACHGPCSATLVCCRYAQYYLLINQLFYVKFLNCSSPYVYWKELFFAIGSCLYVLLSCSTHEVEKRTLPCGKTQGKTLLKDLCVGGSDNGRIALKGRIAEGRMSSLGIQ